jgi:hypothetical protein
MSENQEKESDYLAYLTTDELKQSHVSFFVDNIAGKYAKVCRLLGASEDEKKLKNKFMVDVFMKLRTQPGVEFSHGLYIMQEELKLIDVEENLYADDDKNEVVEDLVNTDTK